MTAVIVVVVIVAVLGLLFFFAAVKVAREYERGIVFRLSALFGMDSFGGGFIVQSIVAYWFTIRFGLGVDALGPVFAASNLLSAMSLLLAERLASRIGLINTMVWSHVPVFPSQMEIFELGVPGGVAPSPAMMSGHPSPFTSPTAASTPAEKSA